MQTNFNIESFLDLSGYEATRKNRNFGDTLIKTKEKLNNIKI